MKSDLNKEFILISSKEEINEFIENNENTLKILCAIKPQLLKHFPDNQFSLEVSDELKWTSETKLLL